MSYLLDGSQFSEQPESCRNSLKAQLILDVSNLRQLELQVIDLRYNEIQYLDDKSSRTVDALHGYQTVKCVTAVKERNPIHVLPVLRVRCSKR